MRWPVWQRDLMGIALEEARKGLGRTYPNPAVGAVVARGKRIVGRGFHRRWGLPHAEVEAIRSAGRLCKGSDLFVTLEPCAHQGRTPPCTDAIIRSGIRRVLVPTIDPNPAVRGRGLTQLRRAGIEVHRGLEAKAARRLNEPYFKFMEEGRVFVTLKIGQTIDGKIAMQDGHSRWITSLAARKVARTMRAEAQAVMVGVRTIIKDNPMLLPVPRRKHAYQRCVLDSRLSIPLASDLVRTARDFPTIVYCSSPEKARRQRLEEAGVAVRVVGASGRGRVDLDEVASDLASMGIMHLFVEGGRETFSSFMKSRLVDRLAVFIAPRIVGQGDGLDSFGNLDVRSLDRCYRFRLDDMRRIGGDVLVILYPEGLKACLPA